MQLSSISAAAARRWRAPPVSDGLSAVDLPPRGPLSYASGGIFQGALARSGGSRDGWSTGRALKDSEPCPQATRSCSAMGMHGLPAANYALRQAVLRLVIGARFADRATGKLAEFCPHARVVHFEIDAAEIGKLRHADVALCGALAETLPAVSEAMGLALARRRWQAGARGVNETPESAPWDGEGLCPRDLLAALEADIVTTDVGQHQMWAAQHLRFHDGMQLMTSGGLGTMGFALPAAIGAQVARPDARVACITGDGSLMMMIHELATLRRYSLPVRIVLFDNSCLGMVRQQQELLFGNRESEIDLGDATLPRSLVPSASRADADPQCRHRRRSGGREGCGRSFLAALQTRPAGDVGRSCPRAAATTRCSFPLLWRGRAVLCAWRRSREPPAVGRR